MIGDNPDRKEMPFPELRLLAILGPSVAFFSAAKARKGTAKAGAVFPLTTLDFGPRLHYKVFNPVPNWHLFHEIAIHPGELGDLED